MGQKVNPHGLRVGVIKDWDSRWFTKDEEFGDTLVSDYKVRKYLKKSLMPRRCSEDRDRARQSSRKDVRVHSLRKARYGYRSRRLRDRQAQSCDLEKIVPASP